MEAPRCLRSTSPRLRLQTARCLPAKPRTPLIRLAKALLLPSRASAVLARAQAEARIILPPAQARVNPKPPHPFRTRTLALTELVALQPLPSHCPKADNSVP